MGGQLVNLATEETMPMRRGGTLWSAERKNFKKERKPRLIDVLHNNFKNDIKLFVTFSLSVTYAM